MGKTKPKVKALVLDVIQKKQPSLQITAISLHRLLGRLLKLEREAKKDDSGEAKKEAPANDLNSASKPIKKAPKSESKVGSAPARSQAKPKAKTKPKTKKAAKDDKIAASETDKVVDDEPSESAE